MSSVCLLPLPWWTTSLGHREDITLGPWCSQVNTFALSWPGLIFCQRKSTNHSDNSRYVNLGKTEGSGYLLCTCESGRISGQTKWEDCLFKCIALKEKPEVLSGQMWSNCGRLVLKWSLYPAAYSALKDAGYTGTSKPGVEE